MNQIDTLLPRQEKNILTAMGFSARRCEDEQPERMHDT
jgi:hypothetical protein